MQQRPARATKLNKNNANVNEMSNLFQNDFDVREARWNVAPSKKENMKQIIFGCFVTFDIRSIRRILSDLKDICARLEMETFESSRRECVKYTYFDWESSCLFAILTWKSGGFGKVGPNGGTVSSQNTDNL